MRGRFALLAVVAVALVGEMALRPTRATVARRPVAAIRRPALVAPAAAELLPPSPASLDGTEVDGRLVVDAHGDLVVSPEVRRFFEYFLGATGEDDGVTTRQRVDAAIDARVPPRAAAQARALYDRFLAYREAARALPVSPSDSLATRLAAVREIRWKNFGRSVADALFGDEDMKDDAALEARPAAVTTPAEREAELRETALRDGGAERLQALDRARADWQRRLDAFRAERARVGDDGVTQLLAAWFSAEEAVRVRALERIAGHPIP